MYIIMLMHTNTILPYHDDILYIMIHLIFKREANFNVQEYNERNRYGVQKAWGLGVTKYANFSEGGVKKHGKYIMHSLYYYTMQLRFGMFLIPVLLVFMYAGIRKTPLARNQIYSCVHKTLSEWYY